MVNQDSFRMISSTLQLRRGEDMPAAARAGALWRVTRGAFRLGRTAHDGQTLVKLAFAGDLMGVECLCAEPCGDTATALIDSRVCMEPVGNETARYRTLAEGFLQQRQRALDMVRLRSGNIAGRIEYLLNLLGQQADAGVIALERQALPSLSELALIVGSTPETVCRELKAFMPARPGLGRPVVPWSKPMALATAS